MTKNYTYLTVKKIVDHPDYPFTFGHLRMLLIRRKENGLNVCIRKVGRSLLFRKDLFDEWIENQQEKIE